MKGKRAWTRWFADRVGYNGLDWAQGWLQELSSENSLGSDYLLFAANGAMDAWLDRPAEYIDARRALHFILMLACRLKAEEAVEYNPHGFRHILVSAGGSSLRRLVLCPRAILTDWDTGRVAP